MFWRGRQCAPDPVDEQHRTGGSDSKAHSLHSPLSPNTALVTHALSSKTVSGPLHLRIKVGTKDRLVCRSDRSSHHPFAHLKNIVVK